MPYTRNFGMRSFENVVRAARFRVPAQPSFSGDNGHVDGLALIGTAVKIDTANPGLLTRPAAAEEPGAHCGVVVYEHIQRMGTDPFLTVAQDFEVVPAGQYAQIMRGPGVKVWFKNTEAKTSYDGRVTPGRTLVDLTDVVVGDGLTVAADGTFEKAGDDGETPPVPDGVWFIVEQIDADAGLVEARFTF